MINNNLSSSNEQYLATLDAINKFNLSSIYKMPKIKEIKISFYSEDLMNTLSNPTNKQRTMFIRALLFLQALFGQMPEIKTQRKKIKSKLANKNDNNYIFTITLKNNSQIKEFIDRLNLETEFFNKDNIIRPNFKQEGFSTFSFNCLLMANNFFEIKELVNSRFSDVNVDKLKIHTNFILENIPTNFKLNNDILSHICYLKY
jgi:hypothetical protein